MENTTSTLSLLSTQALLEHARTGSNSAWKVILRRYEMTLMVSARRQLGHHADAEDVVQSAFLNAISALEKFEYRDEGSFRRYLTTTVIHACRDIMKSHPPRKPGDLTSVPDPRSIQESQPQVDQLIVALEELSESLRDVILMRKYESKPWAEVAEVLGESESTARRRYVDAIKILQHKLA